MLFYATDDEVAATTIERLVRAAGFEPFKEGSLADAGRIEMTGGDLHQAGMNGALLDLDEARRRRKRVIRMTRPHRSLVVREGPR